MAYIQKLKCHLSKIVLWIFVFNFFRDISEVFKLPLTWQVSRGALALTRRTPRRYGFPILSEKIVTFLWNWKDVQWASNDLRMRARRAAKPLSRNPPQRRWLSRREIPWNPAAVRSGIRAKHESESELPPGANDYETTALSASPIVRGLFLVWLLLLFFIPFFFLFPIE